MKKLIVMLFCAMLISSLVACGKKADIPIATDGNAADAFGTGLAETLVGDDPRTSRPQCK